MATKSYNVSEITDLKYNTESVNQLILNGETVWRRSFVISFGKKSNENLYGSWGSASKTAYYGDTITISGTTVTCKNADDNTTRWTNTVSASSQTDQYSYTTPTINESSFTVSAAASITAYNTRNERSYSVTFTNGTYGSWDSITTITALYSAQITKSGNTITVNGNTRTYTFPTDTTEWDYSGSINGTFPMTVGTGKAITVTASRVRFKYAVSITKGTGLSSVFISSTAPDTSAHTPTSGQATDTTGAGTSYSYDYGTKVYAYAVLAEHYDIPSGSSWVLVKGTANATGAIYHVATLNSVTGTHNFGTISAAIEKYTLSITKGTGISTIYYKVNGASSYTSSTSNVSVSVNDQSTYYYYATADNYHTVNNDCGTSSSPKSGTVNCANISTSVSTTAKSYKLVGTYTNGSVTFYSDSARTTAITSANYGATVYYAYSANTGYSGSGNGSLVLNTTNFTFDSTAAGSNATHNFGSATRITWTLKITKSNYMNTVTYTKNSDSAVSVSNSTTLTLDYADTVVVAGTKQSEAQYDYGSITGAGTFTYSSPSTGNKETTVACTRTWKSYTFTLTKNSNVSSVKIWRTGNNYSGAPGATSTESSPLINGTGTATIYYGDVLAGSAAANTGYHFGDDRSTTTSSYSNSKVTGAASWSPTVNINQYTITFTRQRKDATGHQTLGSAVADTSIGDASVTVNYGGSYSKTFSKTNYVSQTKSGSNITADATVTVTLEPATYTLTKSLSHWTGAWYTASSGGTAIEWMYHGYTATFRGTPDSHYEQTISSTRYYNGQTYSTSVTSQAGSVTLSATAITYTATVSLANTAVTVGTSTSSYSASISGTYAVLSPSSYKIYYKINPNSHYDMTVSSTRYYHDNTLSGSSYYVTGNNLSFNDANKTATCSLSTTTYPVAAITYTATVSASNSTCTLGTVSGTYTANISSAYQSKTIYLKQAPNQHYEVTYSSTRYYYGSNYTTSINYTSFTFNDATKTATYALTACSETTYSWTVTSSNSAYCYFLEGTSGTPSASTAISKTYSALNSGLRYKINPAVHYYCNSVDNYNGVPYTANIGKANFTFNYANKTATYAKNCTAISYTVTASLANTVVTIGTATSSYSASLTKTYAELYTSNPKIYFKVNPNSYYDMTVSSTRYYHDNTLSGSSYYVNGTSFTFTDSTRKATYALSTTTYPVAAITYTCKPTSVSHGSVSWNPSTGTYSTLSGTGSTYTITADTGYDLPATSTKKITSFTYSDANKTATSSDPAGCTIQKCTVTWKYLSAYPDTWTTVDEVYDYGQTPSRAAPSTVTNSNSNERKINGTWGTITPIAANEGTRTIQATGYVTQVKCTFSGTHCSANRSNGWLDVGTSITWTGSTGTNYKYSFSNSPEKNPTDAQRQTSGGTVALGTYEYTKTASYIYYNVTITPSSGYSADKTSGYFISGATITFTAPTNTDTKRYSFSTSTSETHTQGKSVSTAGQAIVNDTAYVWMNCSCTGINCSATNGWYRVGTSITWTASSGTNYKYGFTSATNWSSSYATTTSSVVEDQTNYDKTASYLYYNVTITPATNSTANVSSGYRLSGTLVTFTTTTATSTDRYSFSNTSSTSYTYSNNTATTGTKVDSAGKTITGPTVYRWQYCTFTGDNCESMPSSNWYRVGTNPGNWEAASGTNYRYGFTGTTNWSSSYITYSNEVITAGKYAYDHDASYLYYNVTITATRCTADVSSGYRLNGTTVTFTGNDGWYFGPISSQKTTTGTVSTAGQEISATANYCAITTSTDGRYCQSVSPSYTSSTIVALNTTITFTAQSNAGYSASGASTTTSTVTGPGSYSKDATHIYIYVESNNCTANVSTGWVPYNQLITWTANSNCAFDNAGSTSSTTETAYANVKGATYSADAYFFLTTLSNGTGTTLYSHSSGQQWIPEGTTVTWKTTSGYAFDANGTDTATLTVNVPGSTYRLDAVYGYYSLSLTHCTRSAGQAEGWKALSGNPYSTTVVANTSYAFDSSGEQISSCSANVPGTASASPGYGYYYLNLTRCEYSSGTTEGWYPVGVYKTTDVYSQGYGFDGTGHPDTTTIGATVPGTAYASADWAYYNFSAGSNCSKTSGDDAGWYGWNVTVSTTVTASSGYAFDSSGTTTSSITNHSLPYSWTPSPTYGYYTLNLTHCSRSSGAAQGWKLISGNPYSTNVSASSGYAFNSSGTTTSSCSANVPGTASASPGYGYLTVSPGTGCSATGDTTASGWKSLGTYYTTFSTTAWFYAFDGSGTQTKRVSTSVPGTNSASCSHGYYWVSYTNCAYSSGNGDGWYTLGSKPSTTVYANSGYSFGGSSRDTTTVGGSAVPNNVGASPSYGYITVNIANCYRTSGASSGYYAVGSTQTTYVTANSGYAFTSSGGSTSSGSATAPGTITIGPSYGYLSISATNCYRSSGATEGWKELGGGTYTVYFAANSNYAFSASGSTSTSSTVSVPGTASASPGYAYLTVSGSNCYASSGTTSSGWKALGSYTTYFTANSNYAFNSSGGTSNSATCSVPGTNSCTATYGKATISCTNCTANYSTGWYKISNGSLYVKFTANSGYSFSQWDESEGTLYKYCSVPGSVSASPYYHGGGGGGGSDS